MCRGRISILDMGNLYPRGKRDHIRLVGFLTLPQPKPAAGRGEEKEEGGEIMHN